MLNIKNTQNPCKVLELQGKQGYRNLMGLEAHQKWVRLLKIQL